MDNITIQAPSTPAKQQRILRPLPAGGVKTKARSHQQDPASSLRQQCLHREVYRTQIAVQTTVVLSPSPAAAPGAWGRLLPPWHGPEGWPPPLAPGRARASNTVGKAPQQLARGCIAMPPPLTPRLPPHSGQAEVPWLERKRPPNSMGGADTWHPWAPLLPLPGALARHLIFFFFFPSFFFLLFVLILL